MRTCSSSWQHGISRQDCRCSIGPTNMTSVGGEEWHSVCDVRGCGQVASTSALKLRTSRTFTGLSRTLWETFDNLVTLRASLHSGSLSSSNDSSNLRSPWHSKGFRAEVDTLNIMYKCRMAHRYDPMAPTLFRHIHLHRDRALVECWPGLRIVHHIQLRMPIPNKSRLGFTAQLAGSLLAIHD